MIISTLYDHYNKLYDYKTTVITLHDLLYRYVLIVKIFLTNVGLNIVYLKKWKHIMVIL